MNNRFILIVQACGVMLSGVIFFSFFSCQSTPASTSSSEVSPNAVIANATLPNIVLYPVAGTGAPGYSGDGNIATQAKLYFPRALVFDSYGNVFIADSFNHRIRMINKKGIISTLAGTGRAGFAGDGGKAGVALLNYPSGVAVDSNMDLFVADFNNHRIRKVTFTRSDAGSILSATISTIAGRGKPGFAGDSGPARTALLHYPASVAMDSFNNLFIADYFNHRIRKITFANNTRTTGIISTVVGTGHAGFSGDGGKAGMANLSYPLGLAVDEAGTLYIADTNNHRIRWVHNRLAFTNATDTVASDSLQEEDMRGTGDDEDGSIEIDENSIITTIAGKGEKGFSGEGGKSLMASLNSPMGLSLDKVGNVYIADYDNNRIRVLLGVNEYIADNLQSTSGKGQIFTIAGKGPKGSANPLQKGAEALLDSPLGIAIHAKNQLYFTDFDNHRIWRVDIAPLLDSAPK